MLVPTLDDSLERIALVALFKFDGQHGDYSIRSRVSNENDYFLENFPKGLCPSSYFKTGPE